MLDRLVRSIYANDGFFGNLNTGRMLHDRVVLWMNLLSIVLQFDPNFVL
jgi:hypothetical protein